jgi:hypothetical protein
LADLDKHLLNHKSRDERYRDTVRLF